MNNAGDTQRRAYFAGQPTPDLILFATVERGTQSSDDLLLIEEELSRRGVDPQRLAVPADGGPTALGLSPSAFTGPMPGAARWWRESWQLFQRNFGFLATMAVALLIPWLILSVSLGGTHDWNLSLGMIAHVLAIVALDALWASSVFCGLNHRLTQGHCSAGRAIALGIARWGHVFKQTLKVVGLAFGVPIIFVGLGGSQGEEAFIAWGIILAIYPGIQILIRYLWVQPLSICKPNEPEIFDLSVRYSKRRYRLIFGFLLMSALVGWVAATIMLITKQILPGGFLEALGTKYEFILLALLYKTTLLVGFYHVQAHPDAAPKAGVDAAMPPPPELGS
jgi:hypothetical protein